MKNLKPYSVLFLLVSILFSSCYFLFQKRKEFPQPDGFVYVPGSNTEGKSVASFLMMQTEVTNWEYRQYLEDVLFDGGKEAYLKALPDSSLLKKELWISQHFNYFEDPLFDNYPVLGLSPEQVKDFAKWYGEMVKTWYPNSHYTFRLPTREEWEYAAEGGVKETSFGSWLKNNFQNSKGCEFFHFFKLNDRIAIYGDEFLKHDSLPPDTSRSYYQLEWRSIVEATDYLRKVNEQKIRGALPLIGMPVPADTYFPSDYGLFLMNGNVAEMVVDGDRIVNLGGSFRTGSEYCKIKDAKPYPFKQGVAASDVGFRLVTTYKAN